MTIKRNIGEIAPSFQKQDQYGKTIHLKNYLGKKVLIAFFRNAACALCNLQVRQLINRYPFWNEKGLEIIAFFESPIENVQAHVGTQQSPFALVADPKAEIYDLYGVETSEEKVQGLLADKQTMSSLTAKVEAAGLQLTHEEGSNFHRIPAEFLINEKGIIKVAHYNQSVHDHLPLKIIDQFVERN
ncbi:redoxin domain-containing protein [Shimazuella alba]|uniref:Redoxin domain-containing protein n=1 Tax=Shimazuella alba TaxID=2690964 RepID=A0A6I4VR38_9BACL|nr:redoxin domain-containing protein [Shimazuella alba]MXQ52871.1 redoxin domain-containing protein [Shimazuella alba]